MAEGEFDCNSARVGMGMDSKLGKESSDTSSANHMPPDFWIRFTRSLVSNQDRLRVIVEVV